MAELKIPKKVVEETLENVMNTIRSDKGMSLKDCYEKQIPKEPVDIEDKMWCCPTCYNNLLWKWEKYPTELTDRAEGFNYCMACGQRLDWR